MKLLRKLLIAVLLITLMFGAIIAFAPWKSMLGQKIIAALEARGYENASLSIEGLGLKGIVLKDITLGGGSPLTLKGASLDYSLPDLWHKKLGGLSLRGLSLEVIRGDDNRWVIVGLENNSPDKKIKRVIPLSIQQINRIPFKNITVEDSTLKIKTLAWQADLPVQIALEKTPVAQILFKSAGAVLKKGGVDITTGPIVADLTLREDEKKWAGTWRAENINVTGTPAPVPALSGTGTILAEENRIAIAGALHSGDNTYRLDFTYVQAINDSAQSSLLINSASMPWKEGQLATSNVKIPLGEKQATTLNLRVEKVSIDALIGILTGKRVSATGTVSGTVPVIVGKDGSLTFRGGNLKAAGPGSIVMPPDAIPGDSEQIALVREILKDLRYTSFSMDMNSDDKKNLSVLLALEGSNPAVYNGRTVKLNVTLTGDLLDFIRQNIMFLYNPKSLLEAGNNAKN